MISRFQLVTAVQTIVLGAFLVASVSRASVLCAIVLDIAGNPAPHASVSATNLVTQKAWSEQSDKQGKACFRKTPEGPCSPEQPTLLRFLLPIGEIEEGGLETNATVSGTLVLDGSPARAAELCLISIKDALRKCTNTDDLGEYVLVVPPGKYDTRARTVNGKMYQSAIDLTTPGIYRNRLTFEFESSSAENKQ